MTPHATKQKDPQTGNTLLRFYLEGQRKKVTLDSRWNDYDDQKEVDNLITRLDGILCTQGTRDWAEAKGKILELEYSSRKGTQLFAQGKLRQLPCFQKSPEEKAASVTVGELLLRKKADYEVTGKKNAAQVMTPIRPVLEKFGHLPAKDLTTQMLREWRDNRRLAKVTPDNPTGKAYAMGTINHSLAMISGAYTLAELPRPKIPFFDHLRNERTGYFKPEEMVALLRHLHPDYHNLARIMYVTGWRIKVDLLSRRVEDHVDLKGGYLILELNESKTDKPREFPLDLYPELREYVTEQIEESGGSEWLFARRELRGGGKPGAYRPMSYHAFYHAWQQAFEDLNAERVKAGQRPLKKYFHDFRRTAVRNLISDPRGHTDLYIMALVGWTDHKVFAKHYGHIDRDIHRRAVARLPWNQGKRPEECRLLPAAEKLAINWPWIGGEGEKPLENQGNLAA